LLINQSNLKCDPWYKPHGWVVGHRSLVTHKSASSDYNEDLIFLIKIKLKMAFHRKSILRNKPTTE